ncbi:hypothetical protein [Reinekea sp. G2M2-21]|uniref:hypothetical protein n=1 Tax=Reinekea sp. G2M2-21 TaxID=2788942 RepID=UPI0018A8DFDB|nr:hypothetical protein [Reinekea sp. G2M2-21]
MIQQIISDKVADWIKTGEVRNAGEINEGLCADFASAIASQIQCMITGVYDVEDVDLLPCESSDSFKQAVSKDWIGHTALFFDGLFYDSESPLGVSKFEDLQVNQRAMNKRGKL